MEMHQVRYFLAVARTLNFTRAADECNVTQPSLTRAIKQLEAELGGDLFRRERPAGLTELGQRMRPLLRQFFEAAVGARSLASSFKSGEIGALRIALTHSVDLSLLIPFLEHRHAPRRPCAAPALAAAAMSLALCRRASAAPRSLHATSSCRRAP